MINGMVGHSDFRDGTQYGSASGGSEVDCRGAGVGMAPYAPGMSAPLAQFVSVGNQMFCMSPTPFGIAQSQGSVVGHFVWGAVKVPFESQMLLGAAQMEGSGRS